MSKPNPVRPLGGVRLGFLSVAVAVFAAAALLWLNLPTDIVARWAVVPAALLIVASGLLQVISTGAFSVRVPLHRLHRRRHETPRH